VNPAASEGICALVRRCLVLATGLVACSAPNGVPPAVSASAHDDARGDARAKGTANLDAELQRAAESALRKVARPSAVIALDPNTGVVRAVSSVAGERGDPLLTAHVPASTFKVFTAIAALEAGALSPGDEKACTGTYDFGGKSFRCVSAHGQETVGTAIVRSCNGFFYDVGAHMDHARLLDVARRFGFGERAFVDLPDEAGNVEGLARAEEIRHDPSSAVPLLDAIGHGEIAVTLVQLARAFAALTNGGKLFRLGLHGGSSIERMVGVSPGTLSMIRGALARVVDDADGTAHDVAIAGFPFAGKTGGSDSPPVNSGEDRWFVAYAPAYAPAILVAARVEHAEGANDSKHVVRDVLEAYRALGRPL